MPFETHLQIHIEKVGIVASGPCAIPCHNEPEYRRETTTTQKIVSPASHQPEHVIIMFNDGVCSSITLINCHFPRIAAIAASNHVCWNDLVLLTLAELQELLKQIQFKNVKSESCRLIFEGKGPRFFMNMFNHILCCGHNPSKKMDGNYC